MSTLKGVENIDTLMRPCELPGRLRADYLAFNRFAIIEQKSLDVDPDYKAQAFIDKMIRDHPIIGAGQVSLESIFRQLPNGDALRTQLFHILAKNLDDILAKADKQARDTRATFLISEAIGIVVILNDSSQFIQPDLVVFKAFDMLRKRLPTGEIRYPNNHVVLLISEAHRVVTNDRRDLIPIETIFSDSGNSLQMATHCADILKRRWVEFNQAEYVDAPVEPRNVRTRDRTKVLLLKR